VQIELLHGVVKLCCAVEQPVFYEVACSLMTKISVVQKVISWRESTMLKLAQVKIVFSVVIDDDDDNNNNNNNNNGCV